MSAPYQCQHCSKLIPVPESGTLTRKYCPYCGKGLESLPPKASPGLDDTAQGQAELTRQAEIKTVELGAQDISKSAQGTPAAKSDTMQTIDFGPDGFPLLLDSPKRPKTPTPPPEVENPLTINISLGPDGFPIEKTTQNTPPVKPAPAKQPSPVPKPWPPKPSAAEPSSDNGSGHSSQNGAPKPISPDSSAGSFQQLGQYRIERSLGRGGFSEVYLARDSVLERLVAIKVCDMASRGRDDHFQRFLREARLGASLDHPALCQIMDVQREDGVFYIVMEYVEGQNLDQLVHQRHEPLSIMEVSRYALELVEVLKYLSGKGIVHRDIKPGNVIVRPNQSIKLLDLGVGKYLNSPESDEITVEGELVGTPHFMSPEHLSQQHADITAATDLYSTGVTLYYLLTKEFPFRQSGSLASLLIAILHEAPEDPRTYRTDLPDELAQLILQLLAKRPRDRPDHDAVFKVLRKYAGSKPLPMPAKMNLDADHEVSAPPRNTLLGFLDHAVQQSHDSQDVEDELMRLLPRRDGQIYLGEYLLEKPVGRAGEFHTYKGKMPLGGVDCLIRTLPPTIGNLDPKRLARLLKEHGRLMQISSRSAHLSGIMFLGRAELNRKLYPTVYYTVEPWIDGTSLQTIIDQSEDLSHKDASRYLAQAMAGLSALHEQQYLHGNLHPAKLLLDEQARELLITDLTQIERISRSQLSPDEIAFFPLANAAETIATHAPLDFARDPERRQYEAPELFVSNERPSPSTEQYALGVIFIEALTSHMGYVKSARENLDHFTKARGDLEDRLDEISGESPALAQVLWKMVKLNARSRFANLREARNAILRSGHVTKRTTSQIRRPASTTSKLKNDAPPAKKNRGVYDVFISYRREGGSAIARALTERLVHRKYRVFLDVQTLQSGRFDTRLLRYIKNSRNFLLVLTPGALDRCRDSIDDWLRIEISHAIKCRTNIVPVMLPEFQMPPDDQLPHALKSLKKINGVHYDHLQFDGMIEKLQKDFLK